MSDEHNTVDALRASILAPLFLHLDRLAGGLETVDAFRTWFFQNSAWIDLTDDSILSALGNGVMDTLYLYEDFYPRISRESLIRRLEEDLSDAGFDWVPADRVA